MTRVAMFFGALLLALGIGGYYATERSSWTALIPAIFGLAIFGLGLAGLKDSFRKHAMHAAALLGLIGFAATISGLVQLLGKVFSEPALLSKSAMAILCGGFVGLALKSFIDARRSKPGPGEKVQGSGNQGPTS